MTPPRLSPRGLAAGAAAFVIWGLFPLYLHALRDVPALQIIAQRICWACVFLLGWLAWRAELGELTAVFRRPAQLAGLTLSALLIGVNWLVYVWGVGHGHVVEASLGYYINPLVSVVLGVVVLRERLNRVQWLAVAVAALAVAYLTLASGRLPWIACALGVSFPLYGLVRKMIGVAALPGLAIETVLLVPLALAYLVWCQLDGSAAFGHRGAALDALLVGSGPVTALPLFLFAYAARLLPYSTVGLLQYVSPSLQLMCGVWVFGEPFGAQRAVGFVLIWAALAIYATDGMVRARAAVVARP
jgi:chloramphenicol-sensitive protein RarD